MLGFIVLIIVIVVAGVLLFAATRPGNFRVERSTRIKAAPEAIYPLIVDFKRWPNWSPWENIDPTMQRTVSGASEGVGAVYEWQGTGKVGKGRMEILQATAPAKAVIKLDFLKPFEAHNTAEFTLKPAGDATEVHWAMYGASPFMAKLMGLFMNMDQMIGRDFEKGLANMKAAAES